MAVHSIAAFTFCDAITSLHFIIFSFNNSESKNASTKIMILRPPTKSSR